MSEFRIIPFEGDQKILCRNVEELNQSLQSLHTHYCACPTLVNIYDDPGRIAVVGLGSAKSTVQLVDNIRGETHRSTCPDHAGSNVEFSYQGEATFIRPRFLIPIELALRAAAIWLTEHRLSPEVNWLSGPCPPEVNAREG